MNWLKNKMGYGLKSLPGQPSEAELKELAKYVKDPKLF